MAVIYLTHPVHGQKVACIEDEAVNDEKNGWTRYDPLESQIVDSQPESVEVATVKRRGRPPKVRDDGNSTAANQSES